MLVVPGLALCSHHLPAELRRAARDAVWRPLTTRVEGLFSQSTGPVSPPGATGGAGVGGRPSPAVPPADKPVAAAGSVGVERLAALGAVAIACQPVDADGMHVASCRVAMDAAGQLHRVFQAAGPSPAAATAALLMQVEAWRERLATRAAAAPGRL